MMTTTTEPQKRLLVPDSLSPPQTKKSTLGASVRHYFYPLYNGSVEFREYLKSVGNKDSVTANRMFDRHMAVMMFRNAASNHKDLCFQNALDGDIYACLVSLLRRHGMGLKLRRVEYKRLTAPAE